MYELIDRGTQIGWHMPIFPQYCATDIDEVFQIHHSCDSVELKPHEVRIGDMRYTIARPRTVMVHLGNTTSAYLTMMGSWRFNSFTLAAVSRPCAMTFLGLIISALLAVRTPSWWHSARIRQTCTRIRDPDASHKNIEFDRLALGQGSGVDASEQIL